MLPPPLVPVTWQVASGFCSTHLSHYHHHNQTIINFTKTYLTDSDSQIQSLSLFYQKLSRDSVYLSLVHEQKRILPQQKLNAYTSIYNPPPQQTRHSFALLLSAVTLLPLSSLFINLKAKDLSTRSSQAEVKTQKYKGHRFCNHENVFIAVVVVVMVIWWQG